MSEQYDFLTPLPEFNVLPGSDEELFGLESGAMDSSGSKAFLVSPSQEIATFAEPMAIEVSEVVVPSFSFGPVKVEGSPQSRSQSVKSKGSRERKITRRSESKQERQEQRKIKHRAIDRKRRLREKVSIDELKDLVMVNPTEKPDKVNIVAGAVRTIRDLQSQIAELEAKLARSSLEEKEEKNVPLATMIFALTNSGIAAMVLDPNDCSIKEVNPIFEAMSGFERKELLKARFGDAPLFGRYVHGEFPRSRFVKPTDPKQAAVPTASSDDYTSSDLNQAFEVVMNGGSWKLVVRYMSRDGQYIIESFVTLMHIPDGILCTMAADHRRVIPVPPRPVRRSVMPAASVSAQPSCQAQFNGQRMMPSSIPQPLKVE